MHPQPITEHHKKMPTQNHTYRLTAPAAPPAALYSLHPKPYTLKSFTFSAKERDAETGLSYYGSRYYSSDLSIWLSVDPQAAKYPGLSPYVYCANNPIKLVDPNGETVFEVDGETKHIDDGKNGVTVHNVSQRQYKKLETSFSHNQKRYDRLCEKYKNQNGYTSVSALGHDAVNDDGTIQLSGISVSYHAGKGSTMSQIANATKTAIHKLDEGGSGDSFDRKCAEKAQPYVTSGALLLPPVAMINNVHTLVLGYDIYGSQADGIDYALSAIGIVAHPMSFLKNTAGKCAKWADRISTGGTSLYSRYKNIKNED